MTDDQTKKPETRPYGWAEILLEERCPAFTGEYDPNRAYSNGWTMAHFAAAAGNLPVCKILTQAGINWNAVTPDGDTPAHLAADRGFAEVVEFISDHGGLLSKRDAGGRSALELVATSCLRITKVTQNPRPEECI